MNRAALKNSASPGVLIGKPAPASALRINFELQSVPQEKILDPPISEEERPFETLILMGEVTCNMLEKHAPEAEDLIDHEYDLEEDGSYSIFFGPQEGLSEDEIEIAQAAIADFLGILEELENDDTVKFNNDSSQVVFKNKFDFLELLMDYCNKYEKPIINICLPYLPFVEEEPFYLRNLQVAGEISKRCLAENPEHSKDLLSVSFLRPHFDMDHYKASSQLVYESTTAHQMFMSTLLILIGEKIKLADRGNPDMARASRQAEYIIN